LLSYIWFWCQGINIGHNLLSYIWFWCQGINIGYNLLSYIWFWCNSINILLLLFYFLLRLSHVFCFSTKRRFLFCFPISQSLCYCCKSIIQICTYRQKLGKELHSTLSYTGTDYLCCKFPTDTSTV